MLPGNAAAIRCVLERFHPCCTQIFRAPSISQLHREMGGRPRRRYSFVRTALACRRVFFHNRKIPWSQCDLTAGSNGFAGEQIDACAVCITETHRCAGVIEEVTHALAHAIDALLSVNRSGQLLVSAMQAGLFHRMTQYRCLQLTGKVRPLVEQRSRAKTVFRNGGPAAKEGMVVPGESVSVLQIEELRPGLDLIAATDVEGIAFERERMFEA